MADQQDPFAPGYNESWGPWAAKPKPYSPEQAVAASVQLERQQQPQQPEQDLSFGAFAKATGYNEQPWEKQVELRNHYRTQVLPALAKRNGGNVLEWLKDFDAGMPEPAKPKADNPLDKDWIDAARAGFNQSLGGAQLVIANKLGEGRVADWLRKSGQEDLADAKDAESNFNPATKEELKQAAARKQALIQKYGSEDAIPFWEDFKGGVKDFMAAPVRNTMSAVGTSAPMLAGDAMQLGGTVMAATGVGAAPGAALIAGGKVVSTAGGAAMVAGEVGLGAYEEVKQMGAAKLAAHPKFAEAKAAGKTDEQAVEAVALDAMDWGANIGVGIGAASGFIGAKFGTGATARAAGRSAAGRYLKQFGIETASEGVEGGVTQAAQNAAVIRAGDDRSLMRGVGGALAQEALGGLGMSVGVAGVSAGYGRMMGVKGDAPSLEDDLLNGEAPAVPPAGTTSSTKQIGYDRPSGGLGWNPDALAGGAGTVAGQGTPGFNPEQAIADAATMGGALGGRVAEINLRYLDSAWRTGGEAAVRELAQQTNTIGVAARRFIAALDASRVPRQLEGPAPMLGLPSPDDGSGMMLAGQDGTAQEVSNREAQQMRRDAEIWRQRQEAANAQAATPEAAPTAQAIPAAGTGAVEAAGVIDQLEDALIQERDATTSAIENDWMSGKGRRNRTSIERAIQDAVNASTLDADNAAQIVETALENERFDLAQYAASRAMRAAKSMNTTPGVSQSSPKYGEIKSGLEARKKQALDAASALQEIVNSKQAQQAVGAQPAGPAAGVPAARPGAVEAAGVKPADQRQLSADEQAAQDREEARAKEPSLPPALSARLQEAHKAHGRDVKRSVVERGIANEKANNTGTPKAKRERADRIARLEADLALFDEAAAMPPKEAAGPASIPATIGATSEPTPPQAIQASPQPTQAAAAPAAAAGLTDGAPTANTGAQAAPAGGAQGNAQTPDQIRRARLEREISTGKTNNGGVIASLRPSAIEKRKQELDAMGERGRILDAQGKAPRATAEQLTGAQERWQRMTTAERQAVAARTDVKPILRKNLHGAKWESLNVDVQRKLAEAMAPAPQAEAAAQDAAADQVPVKQETRASAGAAPVRQGSGQETADDLRALAAQFRERYQQTGQDTDRTFAAVIDRFAGEVEQGKRTRASFADAEKRYREMLGQATHKDPGEKAMGIDTKGKRPAQVVAEIDARDTQAPATPAPAPAPGPVRVGRDNTPLGEGGKPFKTRKAAGDAKKLQPMMRVVTVPGGYALAEKTPAQLAAEERASRRLRNPDTSARGEPIPAHAFIAAAGGLNRVAASDMGVDGNPRIGNRTLFAGQGRGLSMDQATQMLIQDGYLSEGATINDALALIKKSLTQPQYNADGIERIAQAESDAQFEDYLAAQEEVAQDDEFDPFGPAPATLDGFSDDMLESSGYDAATDAIKAEVRALLEMANAQGIDTESIMLEAHEQTRNATEQDYYEAAKSALEAAITGSNRDRGTPAGSEGQGPGAAAASAAEQGLNQPVALNQQAQVATENVAQTVSTTVEMPPTRQQESSPFARFATGRYRIAIRDEGNGQYAEVVAIQRGSGVEIEMRMPGEALEHPAFSQLNARVQALFETPTASMFDAEPPALELAAQTPAEAAAQQAAQEQAAKAETARQRAADAQAARDDERKRIAQASVRAADSFELGQDPLDSLTGQGSIFDAPEQAAEAAPADDLNAMFDELMAETAPQAPAPKAQPKAGASTARKPRTAAQAAGSAVKNTAAALNNAIDGLGALFGAKSNGRVGSGLSFDENTYAQAKPLFIQAISNLKDASADIRDAMRAVINMVTARFGRDVTENMKPYIVRFVSDVRDGTISQEELNAPSTDARLERDSNEPATEPAVGSAVPGDARGVPGDAERAGGQAAGEDGRGQPGDSGLPNGGTAADGERSDFSVSGRDAAADAARIATGSDFSERGSDIGVDGVSADPIPAAKVNAAASKPLDRLAKTAQQREAEKVPVKPGDLDNIKATLPYLLEGQQEDVLKTETRFAKPDGYGMLFTNGTGTGKTFTGLGVVKRMARQGKNNVLIVVPDDKIAADWIDSGVPLGLNISKLQNTKSAGSGIVITTYANLGDNDALARRRWDMVVADEAHTLMQSADGAVTGYLANLRAITHHPDGAYQRHTMLNRKDIDALAKLSEQIQANNKTLNNLDTMDAMMESVRQENTKLQREADALDANLREALEAVQAEVEGMQGVKRARLLALSATPFAYEFTVDWANGYLFDYNEGQTSDKTEFRGYNQGSNKDRFFMANFGYTMRYNKLTRPDPTKVDTGLLQRNFNVMLRKSGALSSRMLDVAADYDRRFVLVDSGIGNQIDDALNWLNEQRLSAEQGNMGYSALADLIHEKFDYLSRRYLLEAIKATEVVPIVRQHMAMGRKVVVFHDYKKGGGFNPFNINVPSEATEGTSEENAQALENLRNAVIEFRAKFKELVEAPLGELDSPIEVFKREFADVLLVNGDEKKAALLERYKRFQDDASGPQVMLVQSAKNKGWSGHDTTGKHQRVLINLGQPTAPTMAIQQEGRIYRTGQVTDAIMRYLNTGTSWERMTFAQTIAGRASAAENLGMGEQARALKDSFINAFEESDTYAPGHDGEGKGGKERDKMDSATITAFDRAKTYYWGSQKKTSKTKAQEGKDYFATPEPLGLKMAEWLDLRGSESALEPSAGHGAIARWLPETASRTAIEPSNTLRARLALAMDASKDRLIDGTFEDHAIVNKYDGIVMNPPFGVGGKTAIEHLDKASKHLRDGGRIVALIPTGPAADKRFDQWMNGESERPAKPLYIDPNHGPIYKGDTLTITGFGTLRTIVVDKVDGPANGPRYVRDANTSPDGAINITAINKVAPTGPRTESFRASEGIYAVAEIKLPQVTFERAGTAVATRIVILEKQTDAARAPNARAPVDLTDITDINELFNRIEDMKVQPRAMTAAQEAAEKSSKTSEAKASKSEATPATQPKAPKAANPAAVGTVDRGGAKVITHTTGAGKTIHGIVKTDWTLAQARAVDPYTFKKNGGFFIREAYLKPEGDTADISRSFAGQQAATADTMALATAQQRLEAGEDAETVRKETGWHKGADGKWRFEINDADARLKDRAQWAMQRDALKAKSEEALQRKWAAEEARNAWLRQRGESPSRISRESKKNDEFKALATSLKKAEAALDKARQAQEVAGRDGSGMTVGSLLDHPALFAAYPGIADVRVELRDDLPANNASYTYELRSIDLSAHSTDAQLLSTLLHEIQHGIQHIEGFASGGPGGAKMWLGDMRPIAEAEYQKLVTELNAPMSAQEYAQQAWQTEVVTPEIQHDYDTNYLPAHHKALKAKGLDRDAQVAAGWRAYKKLAGEVEARNTQARQMMTDEQRRATPPSATADVADSDVIVTFNGKEMHSATKPANAANQKLISAENLQKTPVNQVRAAITQAYGKLLGQLESKGLVTLAQTEAQAVEAAAHARAKKTGGDVAQIKRSLTAAMQGDTDLDVKRSSNGAVQGFFDPQTGQSFLIADNLTAEAAPGVLMHEVGIHMAADGSMKALFNRAAMMLKLQRGNPFMKAVQGRMDAAGETSGEEAAAYIAEAYENDRANAPASVQRWLADLLAAVKAWMFKKGIMGADSLTVADIAAVARANAKSMARGGVEGGVKFSRSGGTDQTQTEAFKRWFAGSRVVDADGKPLRVYHGTGGDFNQWGFSRWIWASETPDLASQYAEFRGEQGGNSNVMPLYMKAEAPFNGDALPRSVKVTDFINEVAKQAEAVGKIIEKTAVDNIIRDLQSAARREESGPTYSGYDFWQSADALFGTRGASEIRNFIVRAGFDSITYTENGNKTWGVVENTQIKSVFNNGDFDPANPDIRFSRTTAQSIASSMTHKPRGFPAALFSRAKAGAKGITQTQAQSIVDTIKARWANAPEIVVAASMSDPAIPEAVRKHNEAQKKLGAKGEPEGFFFQGKVYILADQMNGPADVVRVLFHETLGHAGLRGVFGDALNGVLRQVVAARRQKVIDKAREYGLVKRDEDDKPVVNVKTATDAEIWSAMSEKDRMTAAEEVLAVMAQESPKLGFVQNAIAAIRTWLRARFPASGKLLGSLSDAEIVRNFILPARRFVKEGGGGGPRGGLPALSRSAADQSDTQEILYSRGDRPTDEAMDFTRDGRADAESLVNLARAKDAAGLQRQLNSKWADLGRTLNDSFHDAMGPAKRWVEGLGASDKAKRALLSGLYRGAVQRDALQQEAKDKHGQKVLQGISKIAKKHGLDAETAQKLVGYWLTANYAPKANDWLLEKDQRALDAARKSGDLDAVQEAEQKLLARRAAINDRAVKNVKRSVGVAGGLNNAQAALMKANIEKRIPKAEVEAVAKEVYALLKWKRDLDIRTGKVTQAMVDTWPKHPDYVPLTGSPFASLDEDVFGTGTNLPNVSKDKAIDGRTESVADDGISAVWREVSKSATHAGFQDFKAALNGVYEDTLLATGSKREAEEALGLRRQEGEFQASPGDDVVIYRNNGQTRVFRFDDKAVIDAIKNGNVEEANKLVALVGAPTRLFSQLATLWNVTFAPVNVTRDVWEKSELVRTRDLVDAKGNDVDGDKVARRMIALAFSPAVWRATARSAMGLPAENTPEAKALRELQLNGGISTWGDHFAKRRGDLVQEVKDSDSKLAKVKGVVDAYNNTFEMVSSLSSYMAMKEQGIPTKEATYQSLDLMNFRKQGTIMGPLRALYAFAQPIVTGGANLMGALKTRKGQARFAAYVALGGMLYAVLRGMADDDEAGNQLDNIGSFVLERSVPIPFGDGVLKIPVGFGLPQLAWSWATNAVKLLAGEQSLGEAALEMTVRNAVKTFSPIQPTEISASKDAGAFIASSMTPTVLKPFAQVALNKTAFGAPIEPKFYKQDVFKSEQGREQTAEFYKDVARELRELTGKDLFPEQVKVIVDGFAIGPMRQLLQMAVTNPNKERIGRETDTPILSAVYQGYNEFAVRGKFFAALDEATTLQQRQNAGEKITDPEELKKLAWAEEWEKQAQEFRNKKAAITRQKLPPEQDKARKDALAKEKESAEARYLMRWRLIEGRSTQRTPA